MDCSLCRTHLANGWNIEQLLQVYGNREHAYWAAGLSKASIFPPAEKRSFLHPQTKWKDVKIRNSLALLLPLHEIPQEIANKMNSIKVPLEELHAASNKAQAKDFIKQEMKVLYHLRLSTTEVSKELFFQALDPLTQSILLA
jgi:hypothetical protein